MTRLLLPVAFALSAIAASVQAQAPLPANQRYCLETRDAGGSYPLLCRFETLDQCYASRTGLTDWCMLNPQLAFQQRHDLRR